MRRPPALAVAATATLAAIAAALSGPATAEVRQSAPEAFVLAHELRVDAPPARVFEALRDIAGWWSDAHTYSGRAANLTLAIEPGGCFCERWSDGGAEHGRVVLAIRDRLLRLVAPLGPLQGRAVAAVLTFELKPAERATALVVGYRVNGTRDSALDTLAEPVDRVLGEQLARLKARAETGKPPG